MSDNSWDRKSKATFWRAYARIRGEKANLDRCRPLIFSQEKRRLSFSLGRLLKLESFWKLGSFAKSINPQLSPHRRDIALIDGIRWKISDYLLTKKQTWVTKTYLSEFIWFNGYYFVSYLAYSEHMFKCLFVCSEIDQEIPAIGVSLSWILDILRLRVGTLRGKRRVRSGRGHRAIASYKLRLL